MEKLRKEFSWDMVIVRRGIEYMHCNIKKIVLSRSVMFDEDKFFRWEEEQQELVNLQPWFKGWEKDEKANEEEQSERNQVVGDETCSSDVSTRNAIRYSNH